MGARGLARPVYVLGIVAAVLSGWAFVYEPSRLDVNRYELRLGSGTSSKGLEIALLADLHIGSPFYREARLDEVVRAVNDAGPDLVLLAGDYVIQGVAFGRFVEPETIAFGLSGLDAPLGVYAVLGNHDHWLDGSRVTDALESAGIRVLDDDAVRLSGFWLVGLDDLWAGEPDVEEALRAVDDDAPVIAFTHNPDLFPRIPPRVDLTLAGHTHGGQVRLPLVGTPIVPSRFGSRYARGHVVEAGRHLFVSSGLGTSIWPVRFRVRPEIALIRVEGCPGPDERCDWHASEVGTQSP